MATQIIQLGDIQLEYQITGPKNAKTLLFVHGLGADLSQFEMQHQYFSSTHQVLSISLRGHGKSVVPNSFQTADFALEKIAKDIVLLLDALKIQAVHYIGNSMGGNIGYELLKNHPKRLYSLTTFGTTGQLKKSRLTVAAIKMIYHWLGIKTIAWLSRAAGNTQASKMKIQQMIAQTSKNTIVNCLPHLANFDYLETIQQSSVRVLLLQGAKDKEINQVLTTTIQTLKQRGNFQIRKDETAGHFLNLDSPDWFNKMLEGFVNERTVEKGASFS